MYGSAISTTNQHRSNAAGSESASGCDFCRIASGEGEARVLLRSDTAVGFFPLSPAAVGHTLLIPRVHVQDIWTLEPRLAGKLAEWSVILAGAIRSALRPDGLTVIQSNGAAASQTVMHLHIHLVPRWEDDALPRLWPPSSPVPEHRLDATATAIRRRLESNRFA